MTKTKNLPLATCLAPEDSFKLGSIAEDLAKLFREAEAVSGTTKSKERDKY